jgi:lysozyme family protein
MASANFAAALAFALRPENDGQGYHVTPGDHGGATAWGVTYGTWSAWQAAHRLPHDLNTFSKLTMAGVAPVYRAWFWVSCGCDGLPPGIDALTFDFANGSGPKTSVELLQRVLGVEADGVCGAITQGAARDADPRDLAQRLYAAQCAFLKGLNQPEFTHGWLRRRADDLTFALSLIPASAAPEPDNTGAVS